jgi:hypothetical protein
MTLSDYYSSNDILFYTAETGCKNQSAFETPGVTGEGSHGLAAEQLAFVELYHADAESLSIKYGIPWETVVAQGILESASGTSKFAKERNNFFGIGAFDSNPDNAYSYPTPKEGWEGYYKNIVQTSVYRDNGVFQEPTITDPYKYLEAIKKAGYATDPKYVDKVSNLIDSIKLVAIDKEWSDSAQLAIDYPEMLTNAAQYASGTSVPAPSTDSNDCLEETANLVDIEGVASNDLKDSGKSMGSDENLKSNTVAGKHLIEQTSALRQCVSSIGGYRSSDAYPEHPTGRALDVMIIDQGKTDAAVTCGSLIAAYFTKNAESLKVGGIIWRQHSWYCLSPAWGAAQTSCSRDRTTELDYSKWKTMSDRGSWTQNHMDHVHIFFLDA